MSAENSSHRKPSHRIFMMDGDSPDNVRLIPIGDAAPSDDGRSYDLRLDVTFSVVAVPVAPTVLF